jgi:hypothetical protein
MKKWVLTITQYFTGVIIFIFYSGAALAFSFLISKPLVRSLIGQTINDDEIFNGIAFIIFALVLVSLGNILIYKQLKKKNHNQINNGLIAGFLFSIIGIIVYYRLFS